MTDSLPNRPVLTTRLATSADIDALVRLINDSFIVERFFVAGDRITVDEVATLMKRGSFLVVDGDDGTLSSSVYLERREDAMYLGLLSVDRNRQRQGIGTALLYAAERHSADQGCLSMEIRVVNVRQELFPYYTKHGYRAYGTEPFSTPELATRPCHFVLMTKSIA